MLAAIGNGLYCFSDPVPVGVCRYDANQFAFAIVNRCGEINKAQRFIDVWIGEEFGK